MNPAMSIVASFVLIMPVSACAQGDEATGMNMVTTRIKPFSDPGNSDIARSLRNLARVNGMPLDIVDLRNTPRVPTSGEVMNFHKGRFWKGLLDIERKFDVFLSWSSTDKDQAGTVWIHDGGSQIAHARTLGRFRLIVTPSFGYPLMKRSKDQPFYLTLQYLPGDVILEATWTPETGRPGKGDKNNPWQGGAHLGTIPADSVRDVSGIISLTTVERWKDITLDLTPGKKKNQGVNISLCLESLRLGGSETGLAESKILEISDSNSANHVRFRSYALEVLLSGDYAGSVFLAPSECFLVDSDGIKHKATETFATRIRETTIKTRFALAFPTWEGDALPAKCIVRIPDEIVSETIKISKMKE